jgi:aromatic ring-opening dioxygenase LigB subunit
MSIIFSAIVPHSPLLNPKVGKENLVRLAATEKAFKKLEEELYAARPDIIIIISPHGPMQAGSFTMNLNPAFTVKFEEFGDFSTKLAFTGNIGFAYKIREKLETEIPLQLMSGENLDYGAAIPLMLLASRIQSVKIIPLYYSGLDFETHFRFGQLVKQELLATNERIAIIASGDLSHKVTKDGPAGYTPKAKKFDQRIVDLLMKNAAGDILKIKTDAVKDVCECGLKSIIMLLGMLDGIRHEPQLLSYEAPFGIGHLVMNFKL